MPNIVRGTRMAGLMTYLVGPGRANEHTEPHLVAGDTAMLTWYDDAELGRDSALAIARHLDRPKTAFDVDLNGGHVWHCSLSVRADEGTLTDEKWNAIATDFVAAMEFDDNDGTKAPCRWVAVHHGLSKSGNDHIHIAVNLIREDGTKASVHHDFRRAQAAARALEVKHDLEQLESAKAERATRGFNPAEREAQARARARGKYERSTRDSREAMPSWGELPASVRQGHVADELTADQPRYLLALKVRAASAASKNEAEFVRRMRRSGLLVRPRFADGRADVVTGYSVAKRPEFGERAIWYGGGNLGRDLTLPRLRGAWNDCPSDASSAAAEWNAAKRGRRVVAPGREASEPSAETWSARTTELQTLVDRLKSVPLDDRDTWATVARQTAGVLAAWSHATEERPGDLGAAAEALSRSAQTYKQTVQPHKAGLVALSGAAMILASAARGGQGLVAQTAMIRQLLRVTQAVHDAAVAGGQARQAQLLAEDTRARLVRVRNAMPQAMNEAKAMSSTTLKQGRPLDLAAQAMLDRLHAGQGKPSAGAASPVPNTLNPTRLRPGTQRGADKSAER